MDAVKFLKELTRMCKGNKECYTCPLSYKLNKYRISCDLLRENHTEEYVKIVEKWSKEHPIMTNRMKFAEVFGCEPVSKEDKLICPPIEKRKTSCALSFCDECAKWWDEEYKHED